MSQATPPRQGAARAAEEAAEEATKEAAARLAGYSRCLRQNRLAGGVHGAEAGEGREV